jgi:hypothetical protein
LLEAGVLMGPGLVDHGQVEHLGVPGLLPGRRDAVEAAVVPADGLVAALVADGELTREGGGLEGRDVLGLPLLVGVDAALRAVQHPGAGPGPAAMHQHAQLERRLARLARRGQVDLGVSQQPCLRVDLQRHVGDLLLPGHQRRP